MTLSLIAQSHSQRLAKLLQEYEALPVPELFPPMPIGSSIYGLHFPKESAQLTLRLRQALIDIAPDSVYRAKAKTAVSTEELIELVKALKADVDDGFTTQPYELAHAEVFGDLFDYAAYLLAEGHKDAAAMIAGGAFESHLRRLAAKNRVAISDAKGQAVKAAKLNEDLAKEQVYDTTTLKQVLAWQGLRNDAAHGDYHKYNAGQVDLFIKGLRGFVATDPA